MISIDPGSKNLAGAVFDVRRGEFLMVDVRDVSIARDAPNPYAIDHVAIKTFISDMVSHVVAHTTVAVIENQFRALRGSVPHVQSTCHVFLDVDHGIRSMNVGGNVKFTVAGIKFKGLQRDMRKRMVRDHLNDWFNSDSNRRDQLGVKAYLTASLDDRKTDDMADAMMMALTAVDVAKLSRH